MRARPTIVPCQGSAGVRLLDQIGKVLEPLVVVYGGACALEVKPAVQRAWTEAFGVPLREPMLSRLAAAIARKQPWVLALWSNDWP